MRDLPPRNVCPACGARGVVREVLPAERWEALGLKPQYRCPSCGALAPWRALLHYTPGERADAHARNLARARRYKREHAERCRDKNRLWLAAHRDYMNARQRLRYAEDPEYRRKMIEKSARYAREHRDKVSAAARKRYRVDPTAQAMRTKRYMLRKWRAAHGG